MSKIFIRDKKSANGANSRDFLDIILINKKKFKLFILGLISVFLFTVSLMWYFWEIPILSPLSSLTTFSFLSEDRNYQKKRIVYGFLPYWNLDKTNIQPEVTHLAYFSLTIDGDGSIITREGAGAEPGFNKLKSETLQELSNQIEGNQGKMEIVLTQFNNDNIVSFLSSKEAHQNLITSLDSILIAYPISGVNIDIEYSGVVTEKLKQDFVNFMQTLNSHLNNKYQNVNLSIDMYAGAATKEQIWDVEKIAKEVDYIIVMAYDFHRRSSNQAGPVAPLFGGSELWDSDINYHLKNFLAKVPKEKILLGVPFYGYEWQTTSRDAQALTYPNTGSTASYERVQNLLKRKVELNIEERWHETSLSPYLIYTENDETRVIHYENARSIAYKMEYVRQLDLAGIAIWALGYEGEYRELWDEINF